MPDEKTECQCSWCKLYRRKNETVGQKDPDELVALVEELFELYNHVEAEYNHLNAIMDGSWPSSVETLESNLLKAKAIRKTNSKKFPSSS